MDTGRWDEHANAKRKWMQDNELQLPKLGIATCWGDLQESGIHLHPLQAPAKTAVSVSADVFFLTQRVFEILSP